MVTVDTATGGTASPSPSGGGSGMEVSLLVDLGAVGVSAEGLAKWRQRSGAGSVSAVGAVDAMRAVPWGW